MCVASHPTTYRVVEKVETPLQVPVPLMVNPLVVLAVAPEPPYENVLDVPASVPVVVVKLKAGT